MIFKNFKMYNLTYLSQKLKFLSGFLKINQFITLQKIVITGFQKQTHFPKKLILFRFSKSHFFTLQKQYFKF